MFWFSLVKVRRDLCKVTEHSGDNVLEATCQKHDNFKGIVSFKKKHAKHLYINKAVPICNLSSTLKKIS